MKYHFIKLNFNTDVKYFKIKKLNNYNFRDNEKSATP